MTRSNSLRTVLIFVVGFELVVRASVAFAAEGATSLPRYRLEPSQELTYTGHSDFKFKDFDGHAVILEFRNEWKVWVVGINDDDGSRRVVISYRESMQRDGKDVGYRGVLPDLAYCDVSSDGRMVEHPALLVDVDATLLFRPLPADRKEIASGWESQHPLEGRSFFQLLSQPATEKGVWTFREVRKYPAEEMFLTTHQSTVTFDPERGVVTLVNDEETQGWGRFDGKGTGKIELLSVKRRDAPWIKQLRQETECYVDVKRTYERLLKEAAKDDKTSRRRLDEAKAVLLGAQAAVSLPIVKGCLNDQLNLHERRGPYFADRARRRARLVGQPAAAWEATDLNGQSHALHDYRGKVVILDFWSRNCGTCALTMPSMKQLEAQYRGQPVVVLGMNVGREADARYVVEKLGLDFVTMNVGHDVTKQYGVTGIPTFVIINQRGNVHDVVTGYSPTLDTDIGDMVRHLLAKEPRTQ